MSQALAHRNISQEIWRFAVNAAAMKLGRRLTQAEIAMMPAFIQATNFQSRGGHALADEIGDAYAQKLLSPSDISSGLDDVNAYQQTQAKYMTPGESPFKTVAVPLNPEGGAAVTLHPRGVEQLPAAQLSRLASEKMIGMANTINTMFDPNSTDGVLAKLQSYNLTYDHISLPNKTVQLDTRNMIAVNFGSLLTKFMWYVNGTSYGVLGQLGNTRVSEKFTHVIQIEFSTFFIPLRAFVNKQIPPKLRMFIVEIASQANIVSNYYGPGQVNTDEKYYHVELATALVGSGNDVVQLTPIERSFKLLRPFTSLDTLTLEFLDNYDQIVFEADRGIYTVSSANPAVFTLGTGTHGLSTGDKVVVYNYESANATTNRAMNIESGLPITKLSNSSFSVPIDTSAVAIQTGIRVYYEAKRITMQMLFRCLEHQM
jgi:hypothetical protein